MLSEPTVVDLLSVKLTVGHDDRIRCSTHDGIDTSSGCAHAICIRFY
jgi:hypothetical protein